MVTVPGLYRDGSYSDYHPENNYMFIDPTDTTHRYRTDNRKDNWCTWQSVVEPTSKSTAAVFTSARITQAILLASCTTHTEARHIFLTHFPELAI